MSENGESFYWMVPSKMMENVNNCFIENKIYFVYRPILLLMSAGCIDLGVKKVIRNKSNYVNIYKVLSGYSKHCKIKAVGLHIN